MKELTQLGVYTWLLLAAVARLKADNPLYGSSLIEYVSDDLWIVKSILRFVCGSFKDLFVALYISVSSFGIS